MTRHNRMWTTAEDVQLESAWGEEGISQIAKAMGRTEKAVYRRAEVLGLEKGVPEGWESITSAVRRTGFTFYRLRIIMRWAHRMGVLYKKALRRSMSWSRKPGRSRREMVDPAHVDAAVAAWMAAETRTQAATRLRTTPETLNKAAADARLWLRRHGEARLPAALWDEIYAARRRKTAGAAAALDAWRARRRLAASDERQPAPGDDAHPGLLDVERLLAPAIPAAPLL